jgi:hypothetical protein
LVARAACDLRAHWLVAPLALTGFALQARHAHEELRDREGGRPMFEPAVIARAGVSHGLLLVTTDHGFNLGHDPRAKNPQTELIVARARDDAHDRQLYEQLGSPPTYRYVYDMRGKDPPRLVPFVPPVARRLEGEAEWPALLRRGHAYPIHYPCASHGKALRLIPGTEATVRLLAPGDGGDELQIGWVATSQARTKLVAAWQDQPEVELSAHAAGCLSWRISGPPPDSPPLLSIKLVTGEGALDYIEVPELTR